MCFSEVWPWLSQGCLDVLELDEDEFVVTQQELAEQSQQDVAEDTVESRDATVTPAPDAEVRAAC